MGLKEKFFIVPTKVASAPTTGATSTGTDGTKLVARVKLIPSHELHSYAEGGLSKAGRALAEWSRDTTAVYHLDEAVDAAREVLVLATELRDRAVASPVHGEQQGARRPG